MSERLPTVTASTVVYGAGVDVDDAAEAYHEASRLDPATALARLPGLALLERDPLVRASAERSARLHAHRDGIVLPVRRPRIRLDDTLERRRSALADAPGTLELRDLGWILASAYGGRPRSLRRRVPSGGALYPLEVYVVARAVSGLAAGLHHYDPFGHRLERLREGCLDDELEAALVDGGLAGRCAAALVLTAVFWRTRFKYGQRGYRFALLEAGHVAQTALLAATAAGLPSLPVGGFYDRELDRLVGADGLDEASLYVLLVGGRT